MNRIFINTIIIQDLSNSRMVIQSSKRFYIWSIDFFKGYIPLGIITDLEKSNYAYFVLFTKSVYYSPNT